MTGPHRRSGPLAIALAVALAAVVSACSIGSATPGVTQRPATGACPTSPPPALAAGTTRTITIATAKGTFAIKVTADLSPLAAGNFVALAACGFYRGVVFHRIVPGFIIQGGDPTGKGNGNPGYYIKDEPVTATYRRGVVAMARTPKPDSQGSQFFIVLDDQAALSLARANTYAIFGEVVSGMDVVDAIAGGPRTGPNDDLALEPVAMDSVTVTDP